MITNEHTTHRKRYTQEEDTIILNCIKEYPENIKEAMIKAQSMLPERSFGSISNRYYQVLTKPNTNGKHNAQFSIIGANSYNINRKIVRKGLNPTLQDSTPLPKPSKWRQILTILFGKS